MFQQLIADAVALRQRSPRAHLPAAFVHLGLFWIVSTTTSSAATAANSWSVIRDKDGGSIQIRLHEKSFATYTYRDLAISRPYFSNIYASNGTKITRNHPPAVNDPQDHEKLHPGMWLAFGDLSGADSWRLAAPVEHVRFVADPTAKDDTLEFTVENKYLAADRKQEICRENCHYTLLALPNGVLVDWDSEFHSSEHGFVFGDQQELGLGVRLAKPIAVKSGQGGRILNSNGQTNEKEAWGQRADGCDYSGIIDDRFIGILLMPHPENVRRSRCHSRDSGFMAMNPFADSAFIGGGKSSTTVPQGRSFRLRYGVLFHWNTRPDDFDPQREFNRYTKHFVE